MSVIIQSFFSINLIADIFLPKAPSKDEIDLIQIIKMKFVLKKQLQEILSKNCSWKTISKHTNCITWSNKTTTTHFITWKGTANSEKQLTSRIYLSQ